MLSRHYSTPLCPICHPKSRAGRTALCATHAPEIRRLSLQALQQDQADVLFNLYTTSCAVQAN